MTRFARNTQVSTERTEVEIRRLLLSYGATAFGTAWTGAGVRVQFEFRKRTIQIDMRLPDRGAKDFTRNSYGRERPVERAASLWEQACRARWRALLLVIKAKLEAVATGICTFEDEFLPWTVLPNGRTVAQETQPQITAWIETGRLPRLLAAPEAAG